MRKRIVAGNWKMNKTFEEAIDLVSEQIIEFRKGRLPMDVEVIFAPPFPFLKTVSVLIDIPNVHVAAQNCYTEDKGAFTGEVSASMIRSAGAEYVIIGHSERRAYFKETHDFLSKKVDIAIKSGLIPIFCCGETLTDRKTESHFNVVNKQLNESIFHLSESDFQKIIIAYEPVWAIGTGVTATPAQAQEMHAYIRKLIADKYSQQAADNTSILYGGSCNAKNAKELFSNADIDGGLIGGASLIAQDFVSIVNAF